MKKFFILCFMAFVICSCGVSYVYQGNITLLTENGDIVEQWDNAVIQQGDTYNGSYNTPYKNGGVEFTDAQGERIYINGGIIIIKKIESVSLSNNSLTTDEELIIEYNVLQTDLKTYKDKLQTLNKKSEEYSVIQKQMKQIRTKMADIENKLYTCYVSDN